MNRLIRSLNAATGSRTATGIAALALASLLALAPMASAADCNINGVDDTLESDQDADGRIDACDNCLLVANADQRDTNGDGYGNLCDADFNNDLIVNVIDLGILRSAFFGTDPDADMNGDGVVNVLDLGLFRTRFFAPPGPGLPEANDTPLADAGNDDSVVWRAVVALNGNGSSDADDDDLGFQWRFTRVPAGSNAILQGANTPTPTFIADSVGTYTVELIVNDGITDSLADEVTVTAAVQSGTLPFYANWHEQIASSLGPKRLRDTIIPGTHDSATSDIQFGNQVSLDCEINTADFACNFFPLFPAAARAQGQRVGDQLRGGIRYLDLRLCEERFDNEIWTCHGLRSRRLEDVLNDIDLFLSQTTHEILLLDFRIMYGLEDADHEYVFNQLRARFGSAMVSQDDVQNLLPALPGSTPAQKLNNVTYDWLWANNKRVIVSYTKERNDPKCPNDDIQSLRLEHVSAGQRLRLYDSAPASTGDDWVDILVKRDLTFKEINTLEQSFEDADVDVNYNAVNGLNGKVSTVIFLPNGASSPHGLVRLYKGTGANEPDLECELELEGSSTYDFTESQPTVATRIPFPLGQPGNEDIWRGDTIILDNSFASTTDSGTLMRKANQVTPATTSKFHLLQGQMTPSGSQAATGTTLQGLAIKANALTVPRLNTNWRDDNVNIMMVDYYELSGLIPIVVDINAQTPPSAGVPYFHLFTRHDAGDGAVAMQGDVACARSLTPGSTGAINATVDANCDNDSADSGVLYDLTPGTVLRIYDNSIGSSFAGGLSEDDWIEIEVLQPIDDVVIDTLEDVNKLSQLNGPDQNSASRIYENGRIRAVRHGTGNLNDRVSRIEWGTSPTGPIVDVMDGYLGTGDLLCSIPFANGREINFTSNGVCDNDRAQSLMLHDLRAGSFLRIYDNSNGETNDDWAQIRIKQDIEQYTITSFLANIDDAFVEMIIVPDNGLDNKVSRIEMANTDVLASWPPTIEFFTENNAGGEVRCSFPLSFFDIQPVFVFSASALGCGNDSIRSVVFRNMPAGVRVLLCDDSNDCDSDDFTQIRVLQSGPYELVGTLESSFNNGVLDVDYSGGNGLDGKVSVVAFFRN